MIKIAAVGCASALLCLAVKKERPEIAMLIAAAAGVILIGMVLPYAQSLSEPAMALFSGVETQILKPILKIIGVSYIAEFSAQACTDAGENAIAQKILLAGRVVMLALAMPSLAEALHSLVSLVSF